MTTRVRGLRALGWAVWGFTAVGLAGCGTSTPPAGPAAPSFAGVKIVAAVVDDPAILPTVTAQRGEWEASRGASCSVLDKPVGPAATGASHVLIFRADRLGDLVNAGALATLPKTLGQLSPPTDANAPPADEPRPDESEADSFQYEDILPAFREQVSKYGPDRVALPYGGSALVLVYRPSAFDAAPQRGPKTPSGLVFEPPSTWPKLDALAERFEGGDWPGNGKTGHGITFAMGPDPEGVADAIYLARAASLGQHRDQYSLLFDSDSMEPRLTTPPFVEALQGLVALKAFGPPGMGAFDADAARKAFRDGDVAMLIDRAERASSWAGAGAVAVAPLPGSSRVFEPGRKVWEEVGTPNRPSYLPFGGGWLVGVSASAEGRERDAAIDFAKYLANPETSSRVRSDRAFPMLPVRASQVGQGLPDPVGSPGIESRLWSDAVGRTLAGTRVIPGLRIPETAGYLADLAKGRVAAVNGESADKALAAVSAAWSERTKKLGKARQAWHYQRSLNTIVTSPQPPAR